MVARPLFRWKPSALNFEPSMDAMVKARIVGPEGFEKTVQLYPEGSVAGRYAGSFKPTQPGAYEVRYELTFPDGKPWRGRVI